MSNLLIKQNCAVTVLSCSPFFVPRRSKTPEYKRIFIFTSDEEPTGGNEEVAKQSKQRAIDMGELEHVIAVYGISTPDTGDEFRFEKFWNSVRHSSSLRNEKYMVVPNFLLDFFLRHRSQQNMKVKIWKKRCTLL